MSKKWAGVNYGWKKFIMKGLRKRTRLTFLVLDASEAGFEVASRAHGLKALVVIYLR